MKKIIVLLVLMLAGCPTTETKTHPDAGTGGSVTSSSSSAGGSDTCALCYGDVASCCTTDGNDDCISDKAGICCPESMPCTVNPIF